MSGLLSAAEALRMARAASEGRLGLFTIYANTGSSDSDLRWLRSKAHFMEIP